MVEEDEKVSDKALDSSRHDLIKRDGRHDSSADSTPRNADNSILTTIWKLGTPSWCRWDPEHPTGFSLPLNILFAFAGAFTVANLYYNHPILNILARDFGVSYIEVAKIPTLAQSGYAIGLLLICPLGDLFPRRPYTLTLVFFTATLWYGTSPCCITIH